MPKIGDIALKSQKDVNKGEKASLKALFTTNPPDQFRNLFNISAPLNTGDRVIVKTEGLETLDTTSDISRKKDEDASLWLMVAWADQSKELAVSRNIKTGDSLKIAVEIP